MPRFTYPLAWRVVVPDPAGPVRMGVLSTLPVLVRDEGGLWADFDVLVDTGASYSFMPTDFARYWNLAIPRTTSRITLLTANGPQPVIVRDADYLLQFPRLSEYSFDLRWLLPDDLPLDAPVLLGLHNTVDLLSMLFDGTMRPDAFMGCMEFATRGA